MFHGIGIRLSFVTTHQLEYSSAVLENLFKACFLDRYNTLLCGGADEPLYQPAQSAGDVHRIFYRDDYFASALHEIAHWCIAGDKRRLQLDYGYWYAPDGRDIEQQSMFEQVEVKPQAIEKAFSNACAKPFRVSIDNLLGTGANEQAFNKNVNKQLLQYQSRGFPRRAQQFIDSLQAYYGTLESVCKRPTISEPLS